VLNRLDPQPYLSIMVKGGFTVIAIATVLCAAVLLVMSGGTILLGKSPATPSAQSTISPFAPGDIVYTSTPVVQDVPPSPPPPPPRSTRKPAAGMPPAVDTVLRRGTLIVISKATQEMYVFKDGALWGTSPVSTGKRGHDTPVGMFPILQKRVFHRSNIYSNAPMPHMQRLTWTGIAIHAGKLPGYPASHGCIRLPAAFAKSLFAITEMGETTVIVTNNRVTSGSQARRLAVAMPMPQPGERGHLIQRPEPQLADLEDRPVNLLPTEPADPTPQLAAAPETRPVPEPTPVRAASAPGQTIQLAAKGSPDEAEAYWSRISARHPELESYEKAIIPATVGAKQYYRLRVTGPGANAACMALKRAGTDCFPVK